MPDDLARHTPWQPRRTARRSRRDGARLTGSSTDPSPAGRRIIPIICTSSVASAPVSLFRRSRWSARPSRMAMQDSAGHAAGEFRGRTVEPPLAVSDSDLALASISAARRRFGRAAKPACAILDVDHLRAIDSTGLTRSSVLEDHRDASPRSACIASRASRSRSRRRNSMRPAMPRLARAAQLKAATRVDFAAARFADRPRSCRADLGADTGRVAVQPAGGGVGIDRQPVDGEQRLHNRRSAVARSLGSITVRSASSRRR